MAAKLRARTKMSLQLERSKQLEYNLAVLKRRDADISKVLDMAGHVVLYQFNEETKARIEEEISADFQEAYKGIVQLPQTSRLGVYVAYIYYQRLFQKIRSLPSNRIMEERIRIPNARKATLAVSSYLRHSFNLL